MGGRAGSWGVRLQGFWWCSRPGGRVKIYPPVVGVPHSRAKAEELYRDRFSFQRSHAVLRGSSSTADVCSRTPVA